MSYRRPAWLEDSELFFFEISIGYAALSASDQKALCGEVDSGLNLSGGYFSDTPPTHYAGVIFNQPMDIDQYYIGGRVRFGAVGAHFGGWRDVEYSTDTTDGEDGTWNTSEAIVNDDAEHTANGWRTPVTLGTPLTGIKAIRFGIRAAYDGGDLYMIHVYGAQTTGDRVEFWHPTLNQALVPSDMYFDKIVWGESNSLDFRIKNSSGATLADNVVLSSDIVTDGSPSVLPDIEFSDGGAYSTSLDIGDITAGSISGTITMRISPDTDDTPIIVLLYPAIAATPTTGPPKSSIYTSFRIMDHYPYTAYDARQFLPRSGPWAVLYDAKQIVPRNSGLSFYDAEQLVEVKPDVGVYSGALQVSQLLFNNEGSLGSVLNQTTLARLLNESWGSSSVLQSPVITYAASVTTYDVNHTATSGTGRSGQSFIMGVQVPIKLDEVRYLASQTRDYTLEIDDVAFTAPQTIAGSSTGTYSSLDYELAPGTYKFGVIPDSNSGHHYTTGNVTEQDALVTGPWIEAWPDERVPIEIDYYPRQGTYSYIKTTTAVHSNSSYTSSQIDITADQDMRIHSVGYYIGHTDTWSATWNGASIGGDYYVRQYDVAVFEVNDQLLSGQTRQVVFSSATSGKIYYSNLTYPQTFGDITFSNPTNRPIIYVAYELL